MKIIMNKKFKIVYSTNEHKNYWVGYYDKSPLNIDNLLLFHKTNFEKREFNANDSVEIGFIDLKTNIEEVIATSRACN